MAAPNATLNSQSNRLIYLDARHPAFGIDSTSPLQLVPRPQRPVRIAVIGNHLPRQCGIATFTTDLCNAIAVEYGASQLSVVASTTGNHPTYIRSGCDSRSVKAISRPTERPQNS